MNRVEAQREARRRWGPGVRVSYGGEHVEYAGPGMLRFARHVLQRDGDERPLARGTSWADVLRRGHWNLVRRFQMVGKPAKLWVPYVLQQEDPITCAACQPYRGGRSKGAGHRRCGSPGCECYCNR
jgi:hypothetical protein